MLNQSSQQQQNVEQNSTAIQAGRDANTTYVTAGLTVTDVLSIVNQVFETNFYKLSTVAHDIATARAKELIEQFLAKLIIENPDGLKKAEDPDFQYSLFTAQKEYARSGDKNLGDLLVDLLIDRSKEDNRSLKQIVLNEALVTAPKLTDDQLAALSVVFFFSHIQARVRTQEEFGNILDRYIAQFVPKIVKNKACYQHIDYCGCGSVEIGSHELENLIGASYKGLFFKGFDIGELVNIANDVAQIFFMPCINDKSKVQVGALNKQALKENFDKYETILSDRQKIQSLYSNGEMTNQEIRSKCIEIRPYMAELFEKWKNSDIKALTLTSVGITIAHANIKKTIGGNFADLSIWIN